MRRLLSRSLGSAAGDSKSGSRRGRRLERSVAVTSSSLQVNGGSGTQSLSVPTEPHDDDEHLQSGVEWAQTSQTTIVTQRSDHQSDSGCEVGLEPTTTDGGPWRGRVLERQDEVMSSSRASSDIGPITSTSFRRSVRQRISLRSFRARSEEFLRRRLRPSCLRRGCDSDDTYGPARRPSSENAASAVNHWLAVPTTVSRASGSQQRLSVDVVVPSRSRQSSRSDDTTVPSSADTSVWNDHGGSIISSVSATFSAQLNYQVRTFSNQVITVIIIGSLVTVFVDFFSKTFFLRGFCTRIVYIYDPWPRSIFIVKKNN